MEKTPLGFNKPISSDSADLRVFVGDNMDLLDSILSKKEGKIYKQSETPASPKETDLWIDTTTTPFVFKLYISSSWVIVGGSNFVEDSLHRFATDAEKNAWNAKADALAVTSALGNKVDKVAGKDLSTNDYTTVEKNKLASLSSYANQPVLNALSDSEGVLYYKGAPIASGGSVITEPEYIVKDAWNTVGTRVLPSGDNYKFYISNTGTDDLTFSINNITITVKPEEEIEEVFDPFTEVTVDATSTFEANVSGLKSGSTIPSYSVKDYFSGSVNTTRSFSSSVYGVIISNDGLNALTYNVNGITLTVGAEDVVEKTFNELTELTVNSSVPFRAYVKSAINAVVIGSTIADTSAPNNVTNLNASNITTTTLTLSWTESTSTDIASYDIYSGTTLLGNTSSTSFNVTGLLEKTQYTFTVKSKDTANNVSLGTSKTVTTADVTTPANVTNLTVTNITQISLTLNWTASTSPDVASYDIFNGSVFLGNSTNTNFNVSELAAGSSYTFFVMSRDDSNNVASGTSVSTVTIPSDVTNLTTNNLTSTSLTVNWYASTGATSYDVYNGATLLTNTASTTFDVFGLTPNNQFTFKVVAKNASGTSIGVTTIATTSSITVNPVTNLLAGTPTINSIPLTWDSSTSDILNYEVSISTDGSNYTIVSSSISSSATSYNLTGLSAGIVYSIQVVAIDMSSNRSTPVTVQKTTASSVIYTVSASPAAGTYGSTQNVVLSSSPSGATIYYTLNGSTPTTASSVYSSPVSVSATQTIKFFAQDSVGNVTSVQTQNYTIDTISPNPVTSLVAGTSTINSIPITWTLSSSNDITSQEVAYSTDGTNFIVASASVNPSSTSYTVSGLNPNSLYTIRVVAIDAASNRSSVATVQQTTKPSTSGGGYYVELNGTSDYLTVPSVNFDEIELEFYHYTPTSGTSMYYFEAPSITNTWANRTSSNVDTIGTNTSSLVINDSTVSTGATPSNKFVQTYKNKAIIKLVSGGTSAVYIGASSTATGFAKMKLYGATLRLAGATVAKYDFSQGSGSTINDVSGNGHSATLTGGTWTAIPTGVVSSGLLLNLTNPSNNSTIPNPDNYFNSTELFTLAFTVTAPKDSTLLNRFVSNGTNNTNNKFNIRRNSSNNFVFDLYGTQSGTATTKSIISGVPYPDESVSYHITFRRSSATGGGVILSINGLRVGAVGVANDITLNPSTLPFIVGDASKTVIFKNIVYYNRNITEDEVEQNYRALK